MLLRHIAAMNADLHQGRWTRVPGAQLEGKTVAVVGFGRIGRRVTELLTAFGAHVMAVDSHAPADEAAISLVPLQKALAAADIVSLHASGDKAILGRTELGWLKPRALVLNASRGGLVDEGALCEALDTGHVSGAWIDAFTDEPYRGPLLQYPQVLLTPHVGSFTVECRRRMEMQAVENLIDALESVRPGKAETGEQLS